MVKNVKSPMSRRPVENLLPQFVGSINYQLLAVMLPKYPNEQLLVAVDYILLRTMASDTLNPIDWSHPPPFTGHYQRIVTVIEKL